jgi:alpha-L-rhamnosidase
VLDITYEDGNKDRITTDSSWKATQNGPIRKNDLKTGEEYDANLEMPGWNKPGFDDSAWHGVLKSRYDGELVPSEGEKILEHERFTPEVLHTPDGATILDFKQNLSGYVIFKVNGKKGQKVRLVHGETLDENGNFTLKNVQFGSKKSFQMIDYSLQSTKMILFLMGIVYTGSKTWLRQI